MCIICLQMFLIYTHFTEVSGIQNTKLFPYKELKMATGNFHHSNKIGEGGFGVVYKVIAKFIFVPFFLSNEGFIKFLNKLSLFYYFNIQC